MTKCTPGFTASDLAALSSRRFSCGHPETPRNSYVIELDGALRIRCLTCKREHARDYALRKNGGRE